MKVFITNVYPSRYLDVLLQSPKFQFQHVAQFEYFTNIPPHKTHIPLIRIPRSGGESASAITIFDGDVHKILHRVVPCALSR